MIKRRPAARVPLPPIRTAIPHSYNAVVRRWILRLLVTARGDQQFISRHGFTDDDVLRFIGLGQYAGDDYDAGDTEALTAAQCKSLVRSRWQTVEQTRPHYRGTLFTNIKKLCQRLELNDAEQLLIAFAVLKEEYDELSMVWGWTQEGSNRLNSTNVLAKMLELTRDQVAAACAVHGRLTTSGLLKCAPSPGSGASFDLLDGLAPTLLGGVFHVDGLLSQYFSVQPGPRRKAAEFAHLGDDLTDLLRYLKEAVAQRKRGSNILLWGRAGVGKTELARTLAAECGLTLNEVACATAEGLPIPPQRRRGIYRLCQHLLKTKRKVVLLFDEMEDFLADGFDEELFGGTVDHLGKAWFNQMLEQAPVPVIWITNDIEALDPAHLRRFDTVLEMKTPPVATRRKMLGEACQGLSVREAWLEQMAGYAHVTPAQIGQAAKLARLLGYADHKQTERVMETSIRRHLQLQGQRLESNHRAVDQLLAYELSFLNPDVNLSVLVDGLERSRNGSCLLYGPPGTGKSAFAHHLSRALKRPLLKKSASDLLDPWVGGTEQKLAAMFEEALAAGSILFLDEADSFFWARGRAQHSWEVTMVNELLQQMETFEGIFICATNFLQVTDDAALRRFDHKIHLNYLRPEQRVDLMQAVAEQLGLTWRNTDLADTTQRLARLHNLTAGDFATLVRQSTRGGQCPKFLDELIGALERESRIKPDGRARPMGFIN